VCCSAYGNTVDPEQATAAWEKAELRWREDAAKRGETLDASEIDFHKKNFEILDRQRHFVKDSFDYNIESVGIYEPRELCKMACLHLKHQFASLAEQIESDNVTIHRSETTMDNCFDFILEHGDYTIGKVLEYALYEDGFVAKGTTPIIDYCGFRKFHPHDTESIIRVSYVSVDADKSWLKSHLKEACLGAVEVFKALSTKF
jgi:DNA-directed RNA polymerase subunit L